MAACAFCKAETELYNGGVPVCVKCSEAHEGEPKSRTSEHNVLSVLKQDLQAATERAREATENFDAVSSDIPSGMPHPDGTQRIYNASRQVSVARVELMRAHHRLNDYIQRRVVPEDLKPDGS
jgi:hypothetical protein